MRILWSSNAMWAATGYGVQAKYILPRFQAMGHEVAQFAWWGLEGGCMQANGITIFPKGYDPYGNDIAPEHCKAFNADLYITLIDLWVQDPDLGKRCSQACGQYVPWLAWFPIDSDPPYPGILQRIPHVDYPVQYSQFGLRVAQEAGAPACRYVPHGVDTTVFHPGPARQRGEARRMMGFAEDTFVCAIVAANKGYPSRKAFDVQLQAFAQFQRRHPEALLYLHSQTAEKQGGLDFDGMCRTLGIPQQSVRMVDQYQQHVGIAEEALANVYRAADVLLGASYAEGFGVPLLEAQACGTPVITTAGTSMAELTVNGIATTPCQKFWSQIGGWWDTPSVRELDQALEAIYGWPAEYRAQQSAGGVIWAQQYDWDVCMRDYWAPLLEEVERDIHDRRAKEAAAAVAPPSPNGHKRSRKPQPAGVA